MSTLHFTAVFIFCAALVVYVPAVAEEIFLKCDIEKMQLEKDGQFIDGNGKIDTFTLILSGDDVSDIVPELDCDKEERFFKTNSTKIFYSCDNDRFSFSYIINRIDGDYFSVRKFPDGRELAYFGRCEKGERRF
jgi:hypothetical protein